MPRRPDIASVLVIGSGPIVIGQAAEFDYSGTQACRVLRDEGLRVILVNSNPATIMTDPEFADATYIEPITPEFVEKIIEVERPDAILATLGGQTALNLAVALHENGVLERYAIELIGADFESIQRGEDRLKFKEIVLACGGDVPRAACSIVTCPSTVTPMKPPRPSSEHSLRSTSPGTPSVCPRDAVTGGRRRAGYEDRSLALGRSRWSPIV